MPQQGLLLHSQPEATQMEEPLPASLPITPPDTTSHLPSFKHVPNVHSSNSLFTSLPLTRVPFHPLYHLESPYSSPKIQLSHL